jgi:hypothetical protein
LEYVGHHTDATTLVVRDGPGEISASPTAMITADSCGSNGALVGLWKLELHRRRCSAGIKVLRGWRKFICAGTTFTVSGTKKSLPTLEWLFLNSA